MDGTPCVRRTRARCRSLSGRAEARASGALLTITLLLTCSFAASALPLLPHPSANELGEPVFVQPFAGLQVVTELNGVGVTEPFFSDLPDNVSRNRVNIEGNFLAFDPSGNPVPVNIAGVQVSNDGIDYFTPPFGTFNFAGRSSVRFEDAIDPFKEVTLSASNPPTVAFTFTADSDVAYFFRLLLFDAPVGTVIAFDDVQPPIYEPGSFWLIAIALIALFLSRRRLVISVLLAAASPFVTATVLTGVSPPIGQPGDVISITGSGFASDAANNVARFGPNRAPVLAASATSLTVQVPNGQPLGNTRVTVNDSNGLLFISTTRSKVPVPANPPRCEPCEEAETSTSADSSDSARLGATLGGRSGDIYSERGEFYQYVVDLSIPGRPGAQPMLHYSFRREYRAQIDTDGPLGHNWNHNYFEHLQVLADGTVIHDDGLGRRDHYVKNNRGEFVAPPEFYTRLVSESDGTFTLRYRGGTRKTYGSEGHLMEIRDRNNNFMQLFYNAARQLIRVNDTLGRDIVYRYIATGVNAGRLQEIEDFIGRKLRFAYDGNGDLIEVTSPAVTGTPNGNDFPNGKTTRYSYTSGFVDARLNHNLLTVTRPNEVANGGPPVLINQYGTNPASYDFDKVVRQTYGGTNASSVPAGGTFTYIYAQLNPGAQSDDPNLVVSRTREVDRNGNIEEYEYNRLGYPVLRRELTNRNLRQTDPDAYETRMTYNADGRLVRTTLPAGNRIEFTYDEASPDRLRQGNLLTKVQVPDARGADQVQLTTTYTYEPVFNQVKTVTDPRSNDLGFIPPNGGPNASGRYRTTYTYDYEVSAAGRGNVVRKDQPVVRLPNGTMQFIITDYAYNQFGQLIRETDPEGNVDEYFYFPEKDPDGDGNSAPGTRAGLSTTTGGYLKERIIDSTTSPRRTEAAPPARVSNRFFYDAVGNKIRIVDGRANDVLYSVNQLNQVVRIQSQAPFRYTRDAFYDANDNVIRAEIENRTARESQGKPLFTDDGNFLSQPGRPTAFFNGFTYDILDRLVEKNEDAFGSTPSDLITRYRYDANENRVLAILPAGNRYAANYDERDLVFTRTRGQGTADASVSTYSYDANRNLLEQCDGADTDSSTGNNCSLPGGDATRYLYDGLDRRVRAIDSVGGEERMNYDPAGNVVRATRFGQIGGPSPSDASGAGNVLLSQRENLYDELNRVFERGDALFVASGVTTTRPVTLAEGPLRPGDGKVSVRMLYDRNSRLTQTIQDDRDTATTEYDGVDRVVRTIDAEGNTATYAYDGNNNILQLLQADRSQKVGVASESITTTYSYDALNRRTLASDNCRNTIRQAYDSRGNLTHYTDAKGDLTIGCPGVVNAQGNSTRYTYDGMSRRLQVLTDLRVGGAGSGAIDGANPFNPDGTIVSSSAWDGNGRMASVADDKGNITRYTYDALDRLTTEVFADGTTRAYTYDRDDNVIRLKDNNGTIQSHRYDALNRRVQTDVARAPGVIGTTQNTYQYDGLSRLTRATDDNDPATASDDSIVAFAYDSLSRVIEEVQNGKAVTSDWFAGERRTSVAYPNARRITMSYDRLDRLKSVADAGAQSVIAEYDYIGPGRVLERRLQNGTRLTYLDDGGSTDIGYDGDRRVIAHRHLRSDNSLIVGFAHNYDRSSNKRFEEKTHSPANSELYAYDSADRLVDFARGRLNSAKDAIVGAPEKTQSWVLDGPGNWRIDSVNGAAEPRAVNAVNEYTMVGTSSEFHDPNGNLVNDSRLGLRWDYLNRLRQACLLDPTDPDGPDGVVGTRDDCQSANAKTLGTYSYDALNRRIRKVVNNSGALDGQVDFYYDGWRLLEERDGAGITTKQYVYGVYLDERLVLDRNLNGNGTTIGAGDERLFYHENSLYSVFALTDAAGAIVEGYQYDAYGQPAIFGPGFGSVLAQSAKANPYLFTGQRLDAETGLLYFKHRYYSTRLGRFLGRDPLGYVAGLNLYLYAQSSPTRYVDPFGKISWKCGFICAAFTADSVGCGYAIATAVTSCLIPSPDPVTKGTCLTSIGVAVAACAAVYPMYTWCEDCIVQEIQCETDAEEKRALRLELRRMKEELKENQQKLDDLKEKVKKLFP